MQGEVTYSNNVQDIFIEVMDGREKILILAAAPHPDIAAIKQLIIQNYDTLIQNLQQNITKLDLVNKKIAIEKQLVQNCEKLKPLLDTPDGKRW